MFIAILSGGTVEPNPLPDIAKGSGTRHGQTLSTHKLVEQCRNVVLMVNYICINLFLVLVIIVQ